MDAKSCLFIKCFRMSHFLFFRYRNNLTECLIIQKCVKKSKIKDVLPPQIFFSVKKGKISGGLQSTSHIFVSSYFYLIHLCDSFFISFDENQLWFSVDFNVTISSSLDFQPKTTITKHQNRNLPKMKIK